MTLHYMTEKGTKKSYHSYSTGTRYCTQTNKLYPQPNNKGTDMITASADETVLYVKGEQFATYTHQLECTRTYYRCMHAKYTYAH